MNQPTVAICCKDKLFFDSYYRITASIVGSASVIGLDPAELLTGVIPLRGGGYADVSCC
jgi:hypothetical protein